MLTIGDGAFFCCGNLTGITIPNSVTTIGNAAFYGCGNLTSIYFPSSVITIGEEAFRECSGLTSIYIPYNVREIGFSAFADCDLTSISVDPNNSVYDSRNNCNAIIKTYDGALLLLSGSNNTVIPDGVTCIGDGAFSGCKSLTSITIPNSVESIGYRAFSGSNITSITIPDNVTSIKQHTFFGCSDLANVTIGSGVQSIITGAFINCTSLETVTCKALSAPAADISYQPVFRGANIQFAKLYVPASALNDYKTTEPWSDFGTIEAIPEYPDITADNYEREYGDPNPNPWTYTVIGPAITGEPAITCSATQTSAPGTYPIVITANTVTDPNATFNNGTLTITPAPLTIRAKSYTIKQGDPLPSSFEIEYEGFKNNETEADLTAQPNATPTVTDSNTPGSYDITVSGATSNNYDITFEDSKLNIRPNETMADNGNGTYLPWGQNSPWMMTYIHQEQDNSVAPADDSNGKAWYDTDFDDSDWNLLTGPVDRNGCEHFGLGAGNYYDMQPEGSCLYLRRSFNIDATEYANLPDTLVMKMSADDRADFYLNGKLVGSNENTGSFDHTFTIAKSDFVVGDNLLAIYYHDESGEAYLDYSLMAADISNLSPFTDLQGITYELDGTQTAWTVTGMTNSSQTRIDIPGTLFGLPVTTINEWVFCNHEEITSITLNEGLTTIGGWAFYDTGITSINIPASVTEIITDHDNYGNYQPSNPFGRCSKLATITVDANNTVYSSPTGSNAIIETATNKLVVGCKDTDMAKLPNVTEIGYAAFHDLTELESFTIPDNITTIGEGAFYGCSNLAAVTVESTTPINISGMSYPPFDGTKKYKLYVPVGTKADYQAADGWNEFKYIWEIGDTEVYPAQGYAYFDASTGTLTFVYDDQYISRTGVSVFFLDEPNGEPQWYYDGTNGSVTDVVIDPSFASAQPTSTHSWFREMPLNSLIGLENLNTSQVTTMDAMFYGNGSITSLDLSNFDVTNVTDMNYMFYNCTGLTSLTLPIGMGKLIDYSSPCEGVGQWGSTPCLLVVPTGFNFNGVDISNSPFCWASGYFTISWDAYAELDASGKLTFYFDDQRANRTGTTYDIDGSYTSSGATSVAFDKSFANYAPTSTAQWFMGMNTLTSITGLDNITTWNISDMTEMFSGCSGFETLDMSHFDVSSTGGNTSLMFDGCSGLKELSVSESMAYLASDACNGVGTTTNPCVLFVPEGFDFQGVSTTGDSFQWMSGTFKLATEETINISSAGMATYCSPRSLDFSGMTDLKAYIITGYDWQSKKVYAMRVYDVPAGTGLYLVGNPGEYQVKIGKSTSYYINMLVGTLSETWIEPTDGDMTNLRLTGSSPKDASFKTFTTGRTFTANKAYLQIPTYILDNSASAVGIIFDDETDGIESIGQGMEDANADWFTLDGRKLNGRPTAKGIYVVKGRKVVIK